MKAIYQCTTKYGTKAVTCFIDDTIGKIKKECWVEHGVKALDVISETAILKGGLGVTIKAA